VNLLNLGYNESMKTEIKDLKFQVGEHVVYPLQGVGIITEIRSRKIHGVETLNYVIYLDISDMTVQIPIDRSDELGVRGIVSESEAKKALESLKGKYEPTTLDWKQRYLVNTELVKEGTISNIAKVVKGLYHRSKIKELPVQERKLYENAFRLLIDESAYALDKSTKEIKQLINTNLTK